VKEKQNPERITTPNKLKKLEKLDRMQDLNRKKSSRISNLPRAQ